MDSAPMSRFSRAMDQIEETAIAVCLGLMTLITFANVIARYVFNNNILWALETTVFLVLMGCSYGVKKQFHIGVDVVINMVSPKARRMMAILSVTACLAFAILLLIGSWDYWYAFASKRAFLETNDVPMPDFLQFFATWLNDGELYEKMPRFIPYLALPLGMALLTLRFLEIAWKVIKGEKDSIIASHEAESAVSENPHHPAGEN